MIQTLSHVVAGIATGLMIVCAIASVRSGIQDRDRVRVGLGIGWAVVAVIFAVAAAHFLK